MIENRYYVNLRNIWKPFKKHLENLENFRFWRFRPTSLFRKSAVVTDGGHFFTFDGRHLTMAGSCTYILAQDMQDGNFSVVANFNNGILISVTLTEPKESIAIKNNGNVSDNIHVQFFANHRLQTRKDQKMFIIRRDR